MGFLKFLGLAIVQIVLLFGGIILILLGGFNIFLGVNYVPVNSKMLFTIGNVVLIIVGFVCLIGMEYNKRKHRGHH